MAAASSSGRRRRGCSRSPNARPPSAVSRTPSHIAGGGPMGQQQALRVLRISFAVVQQIPVQAVDAAVGMATGATLPLLVADRGVVKEQFAAAAAGVNFGGGPRAD